ncbi:RNA polymerase sigma factor [Vibrio phage VAP7]|uniref:RNA polymerase sigma factor n=1 Tax=Vibrio phage VAP7 TaxID=2584487 RepID=A0A4Y5TVA5_9CAUD|nr:RNA polymerase sigma factor [Vibrio phage VAP7]QDB73314.1 RNA polymerase sigma factor [Vibrio phage VAP7]
MSKNQEITAITLYMRELDRYPLLTAEQEYEIAVATKGKGPEAEAARAKLINHNLRLVVKYARSWALYYKMPLLDVIQMGNLGLLTAADKYDPFKINEANGKHYRFSTYAVQWILQCIRREVMNTNSIIRLPIHLQKLMNTMNRLQAQYVDKYGEFMDDDALFAATKEAIPREFKFSRKTFDNALSGFISVGTDMRYNEDGEAESLYDFTADDVDYLEKQEVIKVLETFDNDLLTEKEMFVLVRRYGLDPNIGDRTLEETGADMGKEFGKAITRERVRQIQSEAVRKLKAHLDGGLELKALQKQTQAQPKPTKVNNALERLHTRLRTEAKDVLKDKAINILVYVLGLDTEKGLCTLHQTSMLILQRSSTAKKRMTTEGIRRSVETSMKRLEEAGLTELVELLNKVRTDYKSFINQE